jgi:hypothetical protein
VNEKLTTRTAHVSKGNAFKVPDSHANRVKRLKYLSGYQTIVFWHGRYREVAQMLGRIFEQSVEKSAISVMARGLLERVLNHNIINEIVEHATDRQYTRDLLFSTVFDLMSQVVCGSHKSLHAAYQTSAQEIGGSVTSIYNKVNGLETETSASFVRYRAEAITPHYRNNARR